ncbi:lipocalin family protein [Altererythrobacter aquiaggeris]|uniref:lipocalin family protein n=1 Tax=Aestuarierythrobacter aquiaggeris TaxID=1898396 RepID=UPI003017975D
MSFLRKAARVSLIVAAALALPGCSAVLKKHPVGNIAVPEPAKPVDLNRYAGLWYELARYEQGFQKDCDGVTAEYTLRGDGNIDVLNRCRKPGGKVDTAKGKAKVVDDSAGAKLKVSFFGPFYGDYWVLDRADDYSWAVVGDPSGRYLWLLSRQAKPGDAEIAKLVGRAEALGFDTGYLRMTAQP